MDGHGGPSRTVLVEVHAVGRVVPGEVVHRHQVGRHLDDVAEVPADRPQDVTDVLDDGAGLACDVLARDGPVSTTATRPRHEPEPAGRLDVRVPAQRRGLALDDHALDLAPTRSRATSTIMSSWPPTMPRLPSSTKMVRTSRSYRRAARSA